MASAMKGATRVSQAPIVLDFLSSEAAACSRETWARANLALLGYGADESKSQSTSGMSIDQVIEMY